MELTASNANTNKTYFNHTKIGQSQKNTGLDCPKILINATSLSRAESAALVTFSQLSSMPRDVQNAHREHTLHVCTHTQIFA